METQPREGGWDGESTFLKERAEPGFLSRAERSCHLPAPPPAGQSVNVFWFGSHSFQTTDRSPLKMPFS